VNELIEVLELIIEKSEKNQDGSYFVPKWLAQKLIRKLNSSRKKEKVVEKKKSKVVLPKEKEIDNVSEIISEEKDDIAWGRKKARTNSFKRVGYDFS